MVGVGDVLLHASLQKQGFRLGFDSLWSDVLPQVKSATLAYANLEAPVAPGLSRSGKDIPDPGSVFDDRVHTSYPMFNYSPDVLVSLKESGFDVLSTANNHSLDRGAEGIRRTIFSLEYTGLAFTGTRKERHSPRPWYTITHNDGLSVAWLACTFSTNGIPDRQDQVLDCYTDRPELLSLVRQLDQDPTLGAIILTPHWGEEYSHAPSQQEKILARELIEAGATAVLGSHPHVPQPLEVYTAESGRQGVIIYSLGNFVSGQFHRLHTRASILATLEFSGYPDQRVSLRSVRLTHLEMSRSGERIEVLRLPFPGHSPAISKHLTDMFGPSDQPIEVNVGLLEDFQAKGVLVVPSRVSRSCGHD